MLKYFVLLLLALCFVTISYQQSQGSITVKTRGIIVAIGESTIQGAISVTSELTSTISQPCDPQEVFLGGIMTPAIQIQNLANFRYLTLLPTTTGRANFTAAASATATATGDQSALALQVLVICGTGGTNSTNTTSPTNPGGIPINQQFERLAKFMKLR